MEVELEHKPVIDTVADVFTQLLKESQLETTDEMVADVVTKTTERITFESLVGFTGTESKRRV